MEHFDWIKGFVLPYINFAIFALLAYKFMKKPLVEFAKVRREKFQNLSAEANRAMAEATRQSEELNKRLSQLDSEIASQVAMSKKSAQDEANRMIEGAKQLAEYIKTEAKRMAAAEVETAIAQLRSEIMSEVKDKVISKIQTEQNSDTQIKLVKNQLSNLQRIKLENLN